MQRIDGPSVLATLPAPRATGSGSSAPGFFAHGDPLASPPVKPTTLDPDWCNAIQEELIAVVAAGGLVPDKGNQAQLLAALRALFGGNSGSNANGTWIGLPGGFIAQIGTVPLAPTGGGANGGVISGVQAFPRAFPTAVLGIFGNGTDQPNAAFHPFVMTFPTAGQSREQFPWTADTTQSGTINFTQATSFYWIAIGK